MARIICGTLIAAALLTQTACNDVEYAYGGSSAGYASDEYVFDTIWDSAYAYSEPYSEPYYDSGADPYYEIVDETVYYEEEWDTGGYWSDDGVWVEEGIVYTGDGWYYDEWYDDWYFYDEYYDEWYSEDEYYDYYGEYDEEYYDGEYGEDDWDNP